MTWIIIIIIVIAHLLTVNKKKVSHNFDKKSYLKSAKKEEKSYIGIKTQMLVFIFKILSKLQELSWGKVLKKPIWWMYVLHNPKGQFTGT